MKERIVGRKQEIDILSDLYQSGNSEFVAICGRRRVGKTFLVRECFEKEIVFSTSGLANSGISSQLEQFRNSLSRYGAKIPEPLRNWQEAFEALIRHLSKLRRRGKKVVFLDELPWMDTPKSGFIPALEGFWNSWGSSRHDILLVVCGSATSWMMNKLVKSHGGLHNRLTRQIYLQPFSMGETRLMLEGKRMHLSAYEIAVCYMVFGGIPFYLNLLDASLGLAQNIDRLLFQETGELHREFDNLYAALFRNSHEYVEVVAILSRHLGGMTRTELLEAMSKSSGKGLSVILANLEYCGFIRVFYAIGQKRKQRLYQLVDFFSLFYFHFMKKKLHANDNFWQSLQGTAQFYTWAGLTFELLCLKHIAQIKRTLGIQGILSTEFAYRTSEGAREHAQIDLLIDRKDNTISVCEAKFTEGRYVVSADEELKIRNRLQAVRSLYGGHKSLQMVMLTTFGVAEGRHRGIVQKEVTLEDLLGL